MCVYSCSLLSRSHTAYPMSQWHKIIVDSCCMWILIRLKANVKEACYNWLLIKWGHWQSWKAALTNWTRTCFKYKNRNENHWTFKKTWTLKKPYHIIYNYITSYISQQLTLKKKEIKENSCFLFNQSFPIHQLHRYKELW